MKLGGLFVKIIGIVFSFVKTLLLFFLALILFRRKDRVLEFLGRRNVILTFVYGILLTLTALIYRLIIAINWLLQQAGPR